MFKRGLERSLRKTQLRETINIKKHGCGGVIRKQSISKGLESNKLAYILPDVDVACKFFVEDTIYSTQAK